MSRTDTRTIGTTGRKPSTVDPAAVRARTAWPAIDHTTRGGPGGGAGTTCWKTATAITAATVQIVTARAPHLVLRGQKRAAIGRGDSAANPEKAYWMASSKMAGGARRAAA